MCIRVEQSRKLDVPISAQRKAANQVVYYELRGHCFGLTSAPFSFNRLAEFLCIEARLRFGCCVAHYFDDYDCCEPRWCADSGQTCLTHLHNLLYFRISSEKHSPPMSANIYLGVETDFSDVQRSGCILVRPKPGRVDKLTKDKLTNLQFTMLGGQTFQITVPHVNNAARPKAKTWCSSKLFCFHITARTLPCCAMKRKTTVLIFIMLRGRTFPNNGMHRHCVIKGKWHFNYACAHRAQFHQSRLRVL